MLFWSGTTVKETEISDVVAYNHANGIIKKKLTEIKKSDKILP